MSKQMKLFLKKAGKFQMGAATLSREAMNDNTSNVAAEMAEHELNKY